VKLTFTKGIEEKALFPVITNEEPGEEDKRLRNAYADVYANIESENAKQVTKTSGPTPAADAGLKWRGKVPLGVRKVREADSANTQIPPAQPEAAPDNPFENLRKAQQEWSDTSLSRNKATVRTSVDTETKAASGWLEKKIKQLEGEIKELKVQLGDGAEGKLLPLKVINEQGITITDADRSADPRKFSLCHVGHRTNVPFRTCWEACTGRSKQMDKGTCSLLHF